MRSLRSYLRTLGRGGPVGLIYAVRIARLERRESRTLDMMVRERHVHRQKMADLRAEHNAALDARQAVTGSAARFWRAIRGQR